MKKICSIICLLIMIFVPTITFANIINQLNETGKFTKLNETCLLYTSPSPRDLG